MRIVRSLLAAAALLCSAPSAAQPPVEQVIGPGQLVLAGLPVVCGGIPTAIQRINDMAFATPGWIILHPDLFRLPPVVQVFIYAHECGHHNVGLNDAAADCWAIRTGRNQGWFTAGDIDLLVYYFGHGTGDFSHAPGPERIRNMVQCFMT